MRYLILSLILSFGCSDAHDSSVREAPTTELADSTSLIQPGDSIRNLDASEERKWCPTKDLISKTLLQKTLDRLQDIDSRTKFIFWQDDYGEMRPGNVRVVYNYQGVRYTAWHDPATKRIEGTLAIWERPNGTHTRRHLDTYSDNNFTGCVNFGIGDQSRLGKDGLYTRWNGLLPFDEGLENHEFWQKRYNLAIQGLAATLGVTER